MTTEEIWKPVVGYEGYYEVSNQGRVRSLDRVVTPRSGRGKGVSYSVSGKILKPAIKPSGHLEVSLSNGRHKSYLVHRLVLEAFQGPAPPGTECCHGDGNPGNNHISNLRWDSSSANHLDKVRHGNHPNARKTECKRGHRLEGPNLYIRNGTRICLSCKRELSLSWVQKRPFDIKLANARYRGLIGEGA